MMIGRFRKMSGDIHAPSERMEKCLANSVTFSMYENVRHCDNQYNIPRSVTQHHLDRPRPNARQAPKNAEI
jgi:hypothetical protein